MNEAKLNTIIGHSMQWHFKPKDNTGQLLCFDGFAIMDGKPMYWEAKNLTKPGAFNFSRLEDHQIANLLFIQSTLKVPNYCLILIGVDFGRADKRVYVFKDMAYIDKRKKEKKSILKKEFAKRKNYVLVRNGLINVEEMINLSHEDEYI